MAFSDRTNYEADVVSLKIEATTTTGTITGYGAAGLPPGLNVVGDYIQGVITDSAAPGSPYDVTITATDSEGGTDSCTISPISDRSDPAGKTVSGRRCRRPSAPMTLTTIP